MFDPIKFKFPPGSNSGTTTTGSDQCTPDGCPAPNTYTDPVPQVSDPLPNPDSAPQALSPWVTYMPYIFIVLAAFLAYAIWSNRSKG